MKSNSTVFDDNCTQHANPNYKELQLVDKKQSSSSPTLQKKCRSEVVIEQFCQVVHLQLAAYKKQLPSKCFADHVMMGVCEFVCQM